MWRTVPNLPISSSPRLNGSNGITPAQRAARIARWERIGPRLIEADLQGRRRRLVGGEEWVPIARQWLLEKHVEREAALREATAVPRQPIWLALTPEVVAREATHRLRGLMRSWRRLALRWQKWRVSFNRNGSVRNSVPKEDG